MDDTISFLATSVQPNYIFSQPASVSGTQTVALHRPSNITPKHSDPKLTASVSIAPDPASALTFSNASLIKTNPQTQIKTIVPNQLAGSPVAVRPPMTGTLVHSGAVSTPLTVVSSPSVLVKPDAGQAVGMLRPGTASPVVSTVSVRPGVPAAPAPRAHNTVTTRIHYSTG
ncbi:transcription initiation factor TFIID subunit 4 isoform X2 [Silurus meridionalis]|nr:transcription initiation factor TFIID subunit 4 isoform X2 [Silurus meridionalis]